MRPPFLPAKVRAKWEQGRTEGAALTSTWPPRRCLPGPGSAPQQLRQLWAPGGVGPTDLRGMCVGLGPQPMEVGAPGACGRPALLTGTPCVWCFSTLFTTHGGKCSLRRSTARIYTRLAASPTKLLPATLKMSSCHQNSLGPPHLTSTVRLTGTAWAECHFR